jgi:hypothetical protein
MATFFLFSELSFSQTRRKRGGKIKKQKTVSTRMTQTQDATEYYRQLRQEDENLESLSLDEVQEKSEKYLFNQSLTYSQNDQTGIKEDFTYTGHDEYRASLAYNFHYEPTKLTSLQGPSAYFGIKWGQLWYTAMVQSLSGDYKYMAENHDPYTANNNPFGEARFQRPGSTSSTLSVYGIGVGYRFKLLWSSMGLDDFFETIDVYAIRTTFNDDLRGLDYVGQGLKAEYGVHKRLNNSLIAGIKLNYSWSSVKRERLAAENSVDRSLTLTWFNFAFELGYYF